MVEANKYHIPSFFLGPMLRAAVLDQLGQPQEAHKHLKELREVRPDFESKAQDIISRFVKEPSLVAHIIEGLGKAGMKIS